jgi:hypothetical protein
VEKKAHYNSHISLDILLTSVWIFYFELSIFEGGN